MNFLAGVDEVGRGSIAGPVTAAAVILKNTNDIILKKTRSEIENKINIGDKIKVYFNINECTLLND